MKNIRMPMEAGGWERLVGVIVKSELKLADMNYIDLQAALRELGVEQSTSNISSKLNKGTFSAAFLFQALVAIGVVELHLPVKERRPGTI